MQRIALTLFSYFLVSAFSCLQAQVVDSETNPKMAEQAALEKAFATETEAATDSGVIASPEDTVDGVATAEQVVEGASDDQSESTVGEVVGGPAVVSVNPQGELVGKVEAAVNGELVPIEANITLVSGGVLLGKTVANEDGSFSFSNITPGDYNIYGCASSFCGERACTVVSTGKCCDVVIVELDQLSACRCNGFANAPAASFNNGAGFANGGYVPVGGSNFGVSNFAGNSFGGGGGGGGFGGGGASGGRLLGTRAFRLLAVGGIATAIAVGASDDDDDVSPSE